MVSGGCVVYCLNVTSRIKDKLTGYCRMRSKDGKFKPECKMYCFTVPNGVISTKTNEIAGHFSS